MSSVDDYHTELLAKRQQKLEKDNDLNMASLLVKGFKTTGVAIAVWFWGYLGMSVAWIFVVLFFHIVSNEVRKQTQSKRKYALQAMCSEKGAILSRVDQHHAWIYFPEVEKAEWLNKMLKQLWPMIAEYVQNLINTVIEDSIQGYMPSNLGVFKFTNVDIGDVPLRIDGVKVYTDHQKEEEIVADIIVRYMGDASIKCEVKGINFGIKSLKINGKMRVVVNPLISDMPIIGGLSVFFLNAPDVDFDMTAAANVLDLPFIKNTIRDIVRRVVSDIMVLPRRIPICLNANVQVNKIRYPPPEGLVIIHVLEAKDLKSGDVNIMGKGKSDPYCTITIGNQVMKTATMQSTLYPSWNQFFQAVVDQRHGQSVEVKVFDEDVGSTVDDSLGNTSLDIELIATKKKVDMWLPLANVHTGSVHLRALWLSVSSDMKDYIPRETTGGVSDTFATALLLVVLESASNIPVSMNTGKQRNPFVRLKLGSDMKQSSTKTATADPVWSENFNYSLTDPKNQQLEVQLMHKGSNHEQSLATVMVPINSVMLDKDLTLTKTFNLPELTGKSTITLQLILRFLKADESPISWADHGGAAASSLGSLFKHSFSVGDSPGHTTNTGLSDAGKSPFSFGLMNLDEELEEAKPKQEEERKPLMKEELSEDQDISDVKPLEPTPVIRQTPPQPPAPATIHPPQPSPSPAIPPPLPEPLAEEKETLTPDMRASRSSTNKSLPTPQTTQQPSPSPSQKSMHAPVEAKASIPLPVVDLSAPKKSSSKFGQIQLTLRYSNNRSTLVVVVHQCKNLIPCDKDNLADPYARIYLLPDRTADSKRRTKMIKNTLNPCFDETFEWVMGNMELPFRSLDLAVKNDVGLFSKSRTDMGSVIIDLSKVGDLSQAVTQWFDLCDPRA